MCEDTLSTHVSTCPDVLKTWRPAQQTGRVVTALFFSHTDPVFGPADHEDCQQLGIMGKLTILSDSQSNIISCGSHHADNRFQQFITGDIYPGHLHGCRVTRGAWGQKVVYYHLVVAPGRAANLWEEKQTEVREDQTEGTW